MAGVTTLLVAVLALCVVEGKECPSSCLLENLVLLSKCRWENMQVLTTEDNIICYGCYQCISSRIERTDGEIELLQFQLQGVGPVRERRLAEGLAGLSQGGDETGAQRKRRAVRDPSVTQQQVTDDKGPSAACRQLITKIQSNDAATLQNVLTNCPTLDCEETNHMDTCELDTEVCMVIGGVTCPDCPRCRDPQPKSRGKKSLKVSFNDIKSSYMQPAVIHNQG